MGCQEGKYSLDEYHQNLCDMGFLGKCLLSNFHCLKYGFEYLGKLGVGRGQARVRTNKITLNISFLWFVSILFLGFFRYPPIDERDINTILDVGCGGGWFSRVLGKRYPGAKVVGIDTNPSGIEFAKHIL